MKPAYYCDFCEKDVDDDPCPNCTSPTRSKGGTSESRPRPAEPELKIVPAAPSVPRPLPSPSRITSVTADTAQLEVYLKDGYEVFLVAGIDSAGKTELLGAYRQDAYLDEWVREQGRALPTPPGKLNCHAVEVGRRKVVFIDASGEHFKRLYPGLRETVLGEEHIEFLRVVSGHLRGLILLLDLGRLWGPERALEPANSRQVEILSWVLGLLRWLRFGDKYELGPVSFQKHVNSQLMHMHRKLRIPVQVLFSKADCLSGLLVPKDSDDLLRRGGTGVNRTLYPAGEDPLLLAYHCLPKLLEAVMTHSRFFRFDFVHSLVTDRDTGAVVDSSARGVTLSLQWLLDSNWRRAVRRWLTVHSRFWIRLQKFVDTYVKRNDRWKRLPSPLPPPRGGAR